MKKTDKYAIIVVDKLVEYQKIRRDNMKISAKMVITFVIIGFLGVLAQFTPLKEIQVNSGRGRTESLPLVMMAFGFGTAGALIVISFKNKK